MLVASLFVQLVATLFSGVFDDIFEDLLPLAMGSYLAVPIRTKHSDEDENEEMRFGVSEMQGWRKSMEDAHITRLELESPEKSLFAVFDGHGGKEVALFCKRHFARTLIDLPEYKAGDYPAALKRCFLKMDELLCDKKYSGQLIRMQNEMYAASDSEDEEEDASATASAVAAGALVANADTAAGSKAAMEASVKTQMDAAEAKGTLSREEAVELMLKMFKLKKMGEDDTGAKSVSDAGCTSVVALLVGKELFVANAGDSRCVVSSKGGTAVAMSFDHKPNDVKELARIEAAGGYVNDVGRINGNLNLSRCIGDLKFKESDHLPPEEQIITADPDILHRTIKHDDEFLLLACDGIWDVKTNQTAIDFIRPKLLTGTHGISEVVEELLEDCMTHNPSQTQGLGADNMTCMVVALNGFAPRSPEGERRSGVLSGKKRTASKSSIAKSAGKSVSGPSGSSPTASSKMSSAAAGASASSSKRG